MRVPECIRECVHEGVCAHVHACARTSKRAHRKTTADKATSDQTTADKTNPAKNRKEHIVRAAKQAFKLGRTVTNHQKPQKDCNNYKSK